MMERVLQDTKWKADKDAQSVSVVGKAAKEAFIYYRTPSQLPSLNVTVPLVAPRAVSDFCEKEE